MSAPAAVEVSNCTYSYGETRALDGVSFQVVPRAIFGLLGPNGSGKTTLFRILSTLLSPQGGSAKLFGVDVTQRPIEARRQVGIVFQSQSLDPRLTVEENLVHQGHMYGLRGRGLTERIGEVLGRVQLEGRRKDRVETLSGGLRRRADLAKGLLHSPKLLLLDEPSTGVDPVARLAFWRYLEELRATAGVTILLTTHLLEEADACDELAILDRGKLVRQGTPSDLKAQIGGDVVTLAASGASDIATALAEEFAIPHTHVNGDEVRFEDPEGSKWTARLMARFGNQIESVKISRPSLEDVFMHYTGHNFHAEMDQR